MSLLNTEILPFKAQAYANGEFVELTEASLKGHWSVVFFYPADFTFVCPTELEDLAENYAEFKSLGVEVYAVSTDTHFTHKAWHESSAAVGKVQFPMIGDPTATLARNFQVFIEADGRWHLATFFYESAWCFLIVAFILLMERKGRLRRPGDAFLWYLLLYGAERAVVEGLRTDSLMLGPVRVSQLLAALLALGSLTALILRARRKKG